MDYQTRNEIEENYKWDLTSLYANDEDWEKDYRKVKKGINKILAFKGKILASADNLLITLDTYFLTLTNILKLNVYASTKFDEDLGNSDNALMASRVEALYSKLLQNASFIDPEILKGSKTVLNKLAKNKKLKKYQFYLTDLVRYKDHTLTESEEIIVAKLSESIDAFGKIASVLLNSTLDYGSVMIDGVETPITSGNYRTLMTNRNRAIRKEVYEKQAKTLKKYENTFASSLSAAMKAENQLASIRGHKSLLVKNLFGSNIPGAVYTNLFETVENRCDVYQKYFKMVQKSLGLEKLMYYDINAELVDSDLTFTVEETKLLLEKALAVLGDEYIKIVTTAFDERWIDFGTYKGKAAGAYCINNYGNHPYVLTNFRGYFKDVSTIAHELGHAVNNYFSMNINQPHDYYGGLFLAEIASLTNEVLLSYYIITNSNDRNLKLTAIYNMLFVIQYNLFDACIEGKLEQMVYETFDKGEEIGVEMLNETSYNIRKSYLNDAVHLDDHIKTFWIKRSHYFSPYYLFKYATGVSAAVYIAKKIINGEDNMKDKYLTFLGNGGTNYPTEILKKIGVDMTKPDVINEAIDFMDYLIDEFNKISEEI